jgi:hypothetical protein
MTRFLYVFVAFPLLGFGLQNAAVLYYAATTWTKSHQRIELLGKEEKAEIGKFKKIMKELD